MKNGKAEAAALGGPERWSEGAGGYRERENEALKAEGFERKEGTELWFKGGVYFGREAALQYCQQRDRKG